MKSPIRILRLAQFLHQKPLKSLSVHQLLQLHSHLITTGLQSHYPSFLFSIFQVYLTNPSTVPFALTLFPQIQEPSKWNLIIRRKSSTNPPKALSLFREMLNGTESCGKNTLFGDDPFIYASLIKACNKAHALLEGKSIHCHVIRLGLDYNVNVLNSLVNFYMGSVNLMSYATQLFDKIPEKSVVTVNSVIARHVKKGNVDAGLDIFVQMLSGRFSRNVKPNYVTFVILISGCAEFGRFSIGAALHCCCFKMRLDFDVEICNVIVDLYVKCGYMPDAVKLFRSTAKKDLVSFNTMISGYAKYGNSGEACVLFQEMWSNSIGVDRVSFINLISACAASGNLQLGKIIHALVKVIGLGIDLSVGTALINMYKKCKEIKLASRVFNELPKQNIASWNSMIHAYVEGGLAVKALNLFNEIKSRNLGPDEVTILGLIMACRDLGELNQGIYLHSYVESYSCFRDSTVLRNALIDMYAKCGSMVRARDVFVKMPRRDVISWTSIIVGHAINGEAEECLAAFRNMCSQEIVPNSVTFLGVLLACDHAGFVEEGIKLYELMHSVYRIEPQIEHYGCVVDMIARAGRVEEAQQFIGKMETEANAVVWGC